MTTYIFPGQGSQTKGMGNHLFDEFKELTQIADEILGYSIKELCLEDNFNQLNETKFTQPALFVVNALSYLHHQQQANVTPNFVAGHSLGEYNALYAAEAFDFVTGLRLVQKRAELMHAATAGAMAAIIGLTSAEILSILQNNQIYDITIANYNSYHQIVIAGSSAAVSNCASIFLAQGARLCIPLKVSGAFHSPLMDAARDKFAQFIGQFKFMPLKFPVIANVTAAPYPPSTVEIANLLTQQISHPVKWYQTIEYLKSHGETEFIEIGVGKILTGLTMRILKGE